MAYPLIGIALIQIMVGALVYLRSPKDIIRVSKIVYTEIVKVETEEIPRMKAVMKNFVLYRYIEILLIVLGLIFFYVFANKTFWAGFGFALSIQAAFMLIFDFFAEGRSKIYLEYLSEFIK